MKIAFHHEDLEEEIYLLQLKGFEEKEKENLIYRLNKSFYALNKHQVVSIRNLIPSS